jgi:hypothetical protein
MIIKNESEQLTSYYFNQYPNFFTSEKQKNSSTEIKKVMDYFANIAFRQYNENSPQIEKNYKLLKGIIDSSDFYETSQNPETGTFVDALLKQVDLPGYVKHYPIMNPPINAMVGELSARPDGVRIKAFDDDSKNEELADKTRFLQSIIESKIQEKNAQLLEEQGYDTGSNEYNEQLAKLTGEQIQEYMTGYTSIAEKWANHVVSALKVSFNIKEKSEECFRDLLVSSRQYYHLFEDKSHIGFNVEAANPKAVWYLSSSEKKYIADAYASGIIQVMELSDILNKYDLTEEEIDYLVNQASSFYLQGYPSEKSNLLTGKTGDNSVTYDVYDPLVARYRHEAEAELMAESQLNTFLGLSGAGYATFGNRFTVVQAYWQSKRKVGKLTYVDEQGNLEVTLVDESYRQIPTEVDIEWTWENQWWKGTKIGPHVYINVEPLKFLDYSPIIGVVFEAKNSPSKSLVDLMKPFQTLYNICMNQLFELLKKDLGVVVISSLRFIPKAKDGDYADAIDQWEAEARARGIIFVDDSPENLRGAGAFQQTGRQDLSRHNEIQGRYNTAIALKSECWELAGFSKERLGSISATMTATGTQAALARSFTQTEPYFSAHEYVLTQLYQAIVDAAQYIESRKPESTISYITNAGENAFIQVQGSEIKLRDFHVYASNSVEDQRLFDELRSLAQPMLQNGASPYDIAMMYSTNSVRQLKDSMRRLQTRQEEYQQQAQQLQQQEIQQRQQQFQETMDHQDLIRREQTANENYQRDLDRINAKERAIIQTFSRQQNNLVDTNQDSIPDLIQVSQLSADISAANNNYSHVIQKINLEKEKITKDREIELKKIALEKDKLNLEEKKMKNELKIAQYNDKGTKNSPKS